MGGNRQSSDHWLDTVSKARITCHKITWTRTNTFQCIQAGGDIYYDQIPMDGTMPHTHDFIEILLVNAGGMIHRVNGERQHLTAGDVCFLRPDDMHGFAPDQEFDSVEVVLLDFDLDLSLSLSAYLGNDAFLHRMTAPVLPAVFKLDPVGATALYGRLLRLNSPTTTVQNRSVRLKVLLVELYAKFFVDDANLLLESRVPDWLGTLCATMRKKENFIGGLSRMKKLACRTPGHLCKAFRKHLHKTPTAFINELRINHAARMLSDTAESIVDIADELDFQSLSRFYALFRETYGISPAAYRNLHSANRHQY
jgi:AraC family transcriptional regulator, dual regulator of chb operon